MSSRRLQLGILFLAIFIDMVGFGIVIPILPLYAERFSATPAQIGWLVGIFSLAQFVFAPLWGLWSDRIGRKPILLMSMVGTAAGFFIMGAAATLWALFLGRLLDGIAGGKIGTAQACVADITPPAERSRAMGLIGAAIGLGFVFGPALGGVISSRFGHSMPMYVAGVMAIINAGLLYFLLPETLPQKARSAAHRREPLFPNLFHHTQKGIYLSVIVAVFCVVSGFSIMTTLFALFASKRHGLGVHQIGYLLAMIGAIGVIIQGGLIGRLLKMTSETRLAMTGTLFLAASLFLLPLTGSIALLIVACCGIGIGNSLVTPTLSGIASRHVDPQWQGRAMGVLQSASSLARWAGPALAGYLLALDLSPEVYARAPLWCGAFFCLLALAILTLGVANRKSWPTPLPAHPSST